MIDLSIIWLASMLSIIDVSLTYYILWYDRKLYPKNPSFKELNIIFSWVMKITKYGPWGLLIGELFSQFLIWGVIGYGETRLGDPIMTFTTLNFLCGAIFVAIWIHTYSIKRLHKINKARKIIIGVLNES